MRHSSVQGSVPRRAVRGLARRRAVPNRRSSAPIPTSWPRRSTHALDLTPANAARPARSCPLWAEDAENEFACLRRMSHFWDQIPEMLGSGTSFVLEHCPQICTASMMPCVITAASQACYNKPAGSSCGALGAHCLAHPTNGKKECVRSIMGGACEGNAFLPPCEIVLDDGVKIEVDKVCPLSLASCSSSDAHLRHGRVPRVRGRARGRPRPSNRRSSKPG